MQGTVRPRFPPRRLPEVIAHLIEAEEQVHQQGANQQARPWRQQQQQQSMSSILFALRQTIC